MIELTEKWAFEVGPQGHDYALVERKQGKTKEGAPKVSETKTYHPTLQSMAKKLANRECMEAIKAADSLEELIDTLRSIEEATTHNMAGLE